MKSKRLGTRGDLMGAQMRRRRFVGAAVAMTFVGGLFSGTPVVAQEDADWVFRRARCFPAIHRNHAVRKHCFQLYKLSNDRNRRTDYWTLHHYGTAKSKDGWHLEMFRLRVYPHEDGPRIRDWMDWNPRQDIQRDRCGTINIGISYVASIGWSHSICEDWDIKFFPSIPGRFHNSWKAGANRVEQSEREVGYAISVAVKQGTKARWHFRSFVKTED